MGTYVLRIWLPDRPGALGAVASRVGAVGGDVVGIDILERGTGRAIDELVIELADDDWVGLLLTEVAEVDGVEIEQMTPMADPLGDPGLEALEMAASLVGASSAAEAIEQLCGHATRQLGAGWGAIVSRDAREILCCCGKDVPPVGWILEFLDSCPISAGQADSSTGTDDVIWSPLPQASMAMILGRRGLPFRVREQLRAGALARIVDSRLAT